MPQLPRNARPLLIAVASVAVGLPLAMLIGGIGDDVSGDDPDERIRRLLEERRQLTERVVKEVEHQHQSGVASFDRVLEAREARGRAELDLCSNDAERVKVLEAMLAFAREAETRLARRVEAGTASTTDALRAKVKRIEAEVELLRATRR